MECTPNEEKREDYFGIITNLFSYFSQGNDVKVTPPPQRHSHPRNSIQQVVYNLKLKRASDWKISTRFGLDAPVMSGRKGLEKVPPEEDKASTNVSPTKCEGEANTRDSSAEVNIRDSSAEANIRDSSAEANIRDSSPQNCLNGFDLSGGEFFQLKEQSGSDGGEESKVEKRKEERKKKREKGKEKSKEKRTKRGEEAERTKEKSIEATDAEMERGMEGTKQNGGCEQTGEGDAPQREEVCEQEETKKKKKMKKTKKTKKKKTRRDEMEVSETSYAEKNSNENDSPENGSPENGSVQMKPARRTSEPRNPSHERKGTHNNIRERNNATFSSFMQPPRSSNSDELAINYISDSKKSYISIRSSNRDKDDVIQLPKLNLSTRGGRSSSGEENETTDGGTCSLR
ncbi:hypothetical protein PVBG_01395 [Plasmodium vivax Brazil I]|uniref:Uncharacterized protein n=2 Tax=Plasmodium vivax TaxID=5855 RepID=A0A0J9TT49_PLAVI|nr:hypothetical protein PVBG_01395 [Plasmodium vivax Brazil I]KMZ97972.1 hypothetical protein PVNG_00310 [Plasmodium vivax North Korean]